VPGLIRGVVARVVIVDDQTLVREGIRRLLELSGRVDVVGEAADGIEAIAVIERMRPDVILLDIRMPKLDGVGVLQRLGADGPPALVLTTFDDVDVSRQAILAGARGYLLKNVKSETLVAAIEAVANGGTWFQPSFGDAVREHLSSNATSDSEPLTPREREVLRLMAAGHSNREIGDALHLAEGTVKNHVSAILRKLDARDRTRAVLMAIERRLI